MSVHNYLVAQHNNRQAYQVYRGGVVGYTRLEYLGQDPDGDNQPDFARANLCGPLYEYASLRDFDREPTFIERLGAVLDNAHRVELAKTTNLVYEQTFQRAIVRAEYVSFPNEIKYDVIWRDITSTQLDSLPSYPVDSFCFKRNGVWLEPGIQFSLPSAEWQSPTLNVSGNVVALGTVGSMPMPGTGLNLPMGGDPVVGTVAFVILGLSGLYTLVSLIAHAADAPGDYEIDGDTLTITLPDGTKLTVDLTGDMSALVQAIAEAIAALAAAGNTPGGQPLNEQNLKALKTFLEGVAWLLPSLGVTKALCAMATALFEAIKYQNVTDIIDVGINRHQEIHFAKYAINDILNWIYGMQGACDSP